MLATFVVCWRESLEAALVVSILLAYLGRIGHRDKFRYIWIGVALAMVACAGFVGVADWIDRLFAGAGAEVFQAAVMVVAVGVVTWMVLWMRRQARGMRQALEGRAAMLIESGQVASLGLLAAIAVFREGAEAVLFLWGIVLSSQASGLALLLAGLAGVGAAIAMAYLLFAGAARINLKVFFDVTSIVMLLIAAGMLAQAANNLISVGMLPPLIGQVWNSTWLLDQRGAIGSVVSALFGYRERPSLLELMLYAGYCAAVIAMMRWQSAAMSREPSRR
jgi:high-affinity iron transporter